MIVLDTHTLIWWVTSDKSLSKKAKVLVEREHTLGEIFVSSISAWEIAMLVDRQRLVLASDLPSWFATISLIRSIKFVPVDVDISLRSVALPGTFHKDPADRLIVATARKLSAILITKDEKIRAYPHVKSLW